MVEEGRNKTVISLLVVMGTIFVLMFICPSGLENVYLENYIVDSLCLVISEALLLRLYVQERLDIFEPITIISFVYIMMYFVTPIYDICVGEYTWYGYNLFQYGVKATLIVFAGYVVFYVCYTVEFRFGNKNTRTYNLEAEIKTDDDFNDEEVNIESQILIPFILVMYAFCFAANAYYLVSKGGNDLLYLLTLGLMGNAGVVETTEASIGFISMFSYCLPAATLLYWEYGNSKALKIILFVPMVILQVARGFRFFLIQIVVTFFAYYFLKRKTRPRIDSIIICLLLLMIPVVLMTLFRNDIRAGSGMDLSLLNLESVQDALDAAIWDNFRIYRNFYGMVNVIPNQYGYVFGRQIIIGTLVMVIPRIVWPGKISSYGGESLKTLIGANIADGQAYSNIGEYYYALGVLGVGFFMGIYAFWMKKSMNKYMYSESGLDIIIHAILLGVNLQLIIRGYTPSNFWYLVFSVLPVWLIKKLGLVVR